MDGARLLGSADPIGKRLKVTSPLFTNGITAVVVGVLGVGYG